MHMYNNNIYFSFSFVYYFLLLVIRTNMSKVNINSKYKTLFNNSFNSLSHFISHNRSCSTIYEPCLAINSFNQNSILQNYNKNKPQKKEMSFTNRSLLNNYCGNNSRYQVSSFLNSNAQFDISTINMKTKLKQKLLDINDTILNKRRKHLHNNLKRSSSLECKAKDILKYSASQRFILNSSVLNKYKAKGVKDSFIKSSMEHSDNKSIWKKNEIEQYQYINDIYKLAPNKKQYGKV